MRVVHDDWANHGEAAQQYRDSFAEAWPMALAAYDRGPTCQYHDESRS